MFNNRIPVFSRCYFASSNFDRRQKSNPTKIKNVKQLKKTNIMNSIKNKVTLIGNLGNAPEIKSLENNKKLARVSIATNEIYKNQKGERVTDTTWHNVIMWSPLADIAEKLLKKGSEVAIEGKLINRSYTDKDGVKRYITEIQASELVLLGKA
jgi:single-strand DNA-binding protein